MIEIFSIPDIDMIYENWALNLIDGGKIETVGVEIWRHLFGHGIFDHVHNNAKFCKLQLHKLLKNLYATPNF